MKRGIMFIGAMVALLSLFGAANGTIWYVHPDSALNAIQAGLDSCSKGDTVLVGPGIYYENLTWPDTQDIDLIGEYGTDMTIIDGSETGSVIEITTGVDSTTIINGFTIQNGYADYGGGILCTDTTSPTITNNTITGNRASYPGGAGIGISYSSSPTITNNTITDNVVSGGAGGGICCAYDCSPTISGNTITDNTCDLGGGGILIYFDCPATITGNTITGNTAGTGGGGIAVQESAPTITNNTITGNTTAASGGGITCVIDASPTISGNAITGNTAAVEGGGIHCDRNSKPTIDSCTISSNTGDGVYCESGAKPVIHYNNITDNTGYGVMNVDASVTVDAEYNWWGDPSGPGGVGPGTGDQVSTHVDYDPWLTALVGVTETVSQTSPIQFILSQNCPNPFARRTSIQYAVVNSQHVTLKVYDMLGREVQTLVSETKESGIYHVCWDGRDANGKQMSDGIYFYRLQIHTDLETHAGLGTGDYTETRKMIMVR